MTCPICDHLESETLYVKSPLPSMFSPMKASPGMCLRQNEVFSESSGVLEKLRNWQEEAYKMCCCSDQYIEVQEKRKYLQ